MKIRYDTKRIIQVLEADMERFIKGYKGDCAIISIEGSIKDENGCVSEHDVRNLCIEFDLGD